MHQTALKYAKLFFETYCEIDNSEKYSIVEIGSQDVNGSLRDVAPSGFNYIGLDFVEGKGVDIVIDDPYKIPLPDGYADIVVTSSCFEHSEFFWLAFLEIVRILKPGGYIYMNAPSNGMYHKYPVDCWRFYPDSGNALAAWARRSGYSLELIESFIGERSNEDIWNDFVAVFFKPDGKKNIKASLIIEKIENYSNAYSNGEFFNHQMHGYEYNELSKAKNNVNGGGVFLEQFFIDAVDEKVLECYEKLIVENNEKNEIIYKLNKANDELDNKNTQLSQLIDGYENSKSWKLTKPLRRFNSILKKIRGLVIFLQKCRAQYGTWSAIFRKALNIYRAEGAAGVKRRLNRVQKFTGEKIDIGRLVGGLDYTSVMQEKSQYSPRVSVIVPNYNHGKFLNKRLESIYNQTYKNIDVIILDDCSVDNSRDVILVYAARYPEKTLIEFNDVNSGGVFRQWSKGLALATGDLIWIAESDDYSELNFLEKLVDFFKNEAVMMSFCRSDFISGESNEKIWSSEVFWNDLNFGDPGKPFVKSANYLVNNAWGVKNIVANASGAIFRHPGNISLLTDENWLNMRLCGDWIFYLNIIRGGLVGYTPHTTNFYRQHEAGTSFNTQKLALYYTEHEKVAAAIVELYKVKDTVLFNQRNSLYLHWCETQGTDSEEVFNQYYSLERVRKISKSRKKNIMMTGYALAAGGRETFPIILANQLYRLGYSISFLNCNLVETEIGVRRMLDSRIPLFEINNLNSVGLLCEDMSIEVIHSHHAWVDMTLAECLKKHEQVAKVISMHGMYELMPKNQLQNLLPVLIDDIDQIVYAAEKNLSPFSPEIHEKFIRIENALERIRINSICRSDLGIGDNDFVLCLVSRAIPEKGWEEAIASVNAAQSKCKRQLHLVLIGEGSEYDRLTETNKEAFVHFMGFKSNIRDYFAMADIGFLPSRFKGESFPLVIIDCLFSGKPVLASSIGEIPEMLKAENGLAGSLFELDDFQISINRLSEIIARLANDDEYYQGILSNVAQASKKFDVELMIDKYVDVYNSAYKKRTGIGNG
jgi:glycosyltransferase involved in cell wall biosynthesis/SAM-dependent methyltransferase